MTTLRAAVRAYLAMRRDLGFHLRETGRLLLQFVAFMEQHRATTITTRLALAWAQQPQTVQPTEWARRLSMVRIFARYRHAFNPRTEIPPDGLLPYRPKRARPYRYSDEEIRRLVRAARTMPYHYQRGALRPWVYSCLFGLLSVSGLRLGDARNLELHDVDLQAAVLTTGADRDHAGMIGAARDGTLFLDEIGELGLDLQPKLLRFLESSEICPLGESTPFRVNVRVVAATNSNVEQLVTDGRFRDDLFYRLNVIRLRILPLRERRDEIPALVRHFLALSAAEFKKGQLRLSEEIMEHLLLCRWPGNVRQLQNEVRRMVALAEPNAVLTPAALSPEVFNTRLAPRPAQHDFEMVVPLNDKLLPTVTKIERAMIRLALRDHHSNLDAAARALGISRKGLYLKRQRFGL